MSRISPIVLLLAIIGSVLTGCAGTAADPSREARQILAPTGTLRVGLYPGTPTSLLEDPGSSEPRGVGYDLGKELARRLGVPFKPVVFSKNAEVLDAVKSGSVDVAFTNASAARSKDMDFTAPYLAIELGYLVPAGSPVSDPADVDRPGVRVGVTEHSSSDATLSRDLKAAQVVRAATVQVGSQMLADGTLDVYATNKPTLFEMAENLPGAHVIDGRWGIEQHAIALPKGRQQGLAFAQKFADDAKAEGLLKSAIERAGLRGVLITD